MFPFIFVLLNKGYTAVVNVGVTGRYDVNWNKDVGIIRKEILK